MHGRAVVALTVGASGAASALASAALALVLGVFPVIAQPAGAARAPPPVKIDIKATPIEAFDPRDLSIKKFGALTFRGGLELQSSYKEFGGLSAIRVFADGSRFIALSDKGRWLTGRIAYAGERPVGIADAVMAPILGPDGRPLYARGWFDTESIAEDGGTLYVGIERVNRIVRFDYGNQGLLARGQPVPVPPGVATLPNNKGLECLVVPPKGAPLAGTLIAISERGLDSAGNLKAFLIGGQTAGEFTVKRRDEFDVSDCAITPSGDLLLLERRFSWTTGILIRIRRVALADVKPEAVIDGERLLDADMGLEIDNMEGLSVHTTAQGEVVLTLISDDNFSLLQRTILLQFTLSGR
jgi:hypothetical protein